MKVNLLILYILPFGKQGTNVTWVGPCTGPYNLYHKVIIDWIYSRPDLFDSTKVFIEGFSKNGASASKVVILKLICIDYYLLYCKID